MNKQEILVVLYEMRKDWQSSLDGELVYNCRVGFCSWLYRYYKTGCNIPVLYELKKELLDKNSWIWYPTFHHTQNKQSFIPRIDHLNRTITRLENELKNNCNE